ncbi:hypothetical protein LOTGIDRAFT_232244 [Lottia gigantea]|uniref:Uncharacterized protein n=1 Tax=Lottia gigantea TaxID=225164 RepID=V4AHP0_LOTGI|nr:hypothetical protein LOTGIDRAFT_232244 [Lottia gigantea]ESO94720.1 hypothetical protein LOTGIDRAFT_232244 [Lottia gigantea]
MEFLTQKCMVELTMVFSKIEDYYRGLLKGEITREEMILITEKSDRMKILFQIVVKDEKIDLVLNVRQKEITGLQDYFDQLQSMLNIARLVFKDDNQFSEEYHTVITDSPDKPLNQLYTTLVEFENVDLDNYTPSINPLHLPQSLLDILPNIHTLEDSQLFLNVWKENARKEEDGNLFERIETAWNNSYKEWMQFRKDFESGNISFQNFGKYVFFLENEKHLKSELDKVFQNEELIQERWKQYETFETITTCQRASTVIMDIKDMLKMTVDFSICTKIKSIGANNKLAMKEIDVSLLNMVGKMKELGKEKLELLQSFRKSESVVNWLKETMKDGLKELKVFVDLAFISAGEGDLEIDRVNCFHTVTSTFAPLIFDLTAKSNFETFMGKCDMIFKDMDSDGLKKLSEKLLDTNRQLEWFKAVRQSHGSVEVTSLEQAEMIVSHGIYKINPPTKSRQTKLEIQTVLSLNVSSNAGEKEMLNDGKYSFEKLMDLQSRLMLVAGQAEKGRERVEAFTSTLDGAVRLAKTYVKLCSDGCVFFNSWRAEFLCDDTTANCARLVFGNNHLLTGHRHPDTVETFVAQVANFLEECHEDWLSYLRKKRQEYLELNYYTVEQLVFLQQEIIKVGTDEPNKLIYPLLSFLKEDCCEKDLQEAMKSAQEEVLNKDKKEEKPVDPIVCSDEEIQMKFIDAMENNGFTRELALQAYIAVNDKEDIDAGLGYCLDHVDSIEESCIDDEEDTSRRFAGWSTGAGSIENNIGHLLKNIPRSDRITCKELIHNFKKIWSEFLMKVSSSVSDYLSLEHLGIILKKLANSEGLSIRRNLPAGLTLGQPNLIVCPNDDMLNCLTYMYMHPGDQPLPKPDEVLICSKDTKFDEVDIFLRRAFYDSYNKIHCLAFADYLDYTVGDKCEKRLIEYVQECKGRNYKFVVLCTQENELKTKLVGALENYRSPPPKICTSKLISCYLSEQFTKAIPESASVVDFSRSLVRVIKSERAGVGKTLYKTRLVEKLSEHQGRNKEISLTIPLFEKEVNVSDITDRLMKYTRHPGHIQPMIFHLDISSEVLDGVDFFLYNLLILGCIRNKDGYVWKKSDHDLYLIENISFNNLQGEKKLHKSIHHIFDILPNVRCWSPTETLSILKGNTPKGYAENDSVFDKTEFKKEVFQRPFHYLDSLDRNLALDTFEKQREPSKENIASCLDVLLRHCGIEDPSWAEIHHFALFLNTQLKDWETSTFCGGYVAEDFPGFAKFVLLFSIEMSRDFATRSLKMSEETPLQKLESRDENDDNSELTKFQIKRHWESSPHPYIFFNPDHHTMTFLGFNIDRNTGNLVDQQNGQIIKPNLMPKNLYDSLDRNRAPLNENFQQLPRLEAISKLCLVMGIESLYDPDPSYELTPDNAKKILAIYMRFRCNIPVIIMGETGCGKTRLVKFMCSLQCPVGTDVQNMILMKVHGGTTPQNIIEMVDKATEIATANANEYGDHFYTVLFFDEANTTESIGLIKEIMCDGTMNGKKFNQYKTLKIIAACNPYRKHTDELIKRLENAGLGYHVDADATTDRMGRVPMRRLVYRVQPLPASMLPLVWDFGQLNTTIENLYIQQMVQRAIDEEELGDMPKLKETLSSILVASQDFMRSQNNECSFVSLRDVERVLTVMCWLLQQADEGDLFDKIKGDENDDEEWGEKTNDDEEEDDEEEDEMVNDITIALILALAVCYRSGLRSRDEFDKEIIKTFKPPFYLPDGIKEYQRIIDRCQESFLEDVDLGTNIAKNHALKENIFLMVVCMELRIPLFLVGKPGSSKSLAKTIVADAMQGNSSRSEFFKNFKQTHMVSFQCSPLSTADGILSTFTQCAKIQKDKNLDAFVATVVLDEIGLAEDSSKMPLKTLHPLLEDGCQGNEKAEPFMKVGFIGISNWALDPAKMNRGISVQREIPDDEELMNTADGICSSSKTVHNRITPVLSDLAKSYLSIFEKAREKREFFGLRDFYSLVKMVYGFAEEFDKTPCWHQLEHCIKRNFGGLDTIDAVKVFKDNLKNVSTEEKPHENDPDCSALGLIEAGLFGKSSQSDSRYLLLLTENYGALGILQEQILQKHRVQTIFGSSFPRDQEYTQVCRNINRIKVCMETGNTVILLNLENLYESLYDALNQYYAKFGGERYVDLGLGSHRVKCRVHKNFRLIVVAEKKVVYEKFPIPLINRLEKHFLTLDNIMTKEQAEVTQKLKDWASKLSQTERYYLRNKDKGKVEEAFMGYHSDAAAAIVLKLWNDSDQQNIFELCKKELLWCSTPEAVLQAENSPIAAEKDFLNHVYFVEQQHTDIFSYVLPRIQGSNTLFAQITTHSTLLTDEEKKAFLLPLRNILLLNLQSFDTEQQFCQQIKNFGQSCTEGNKILIIQCDSHGGTTNLVKSAQYCVDDNLPKYLNNYHVIFIVQLDRMTQQQFTGYQGGKWHCLHIDDLRPIANIGANLMQMKQNSVAVLFKREKDMEDSLYEKMVASPSSDSGLELESINISLEDSDVRKNDGCDMYLTDEYFHSKVVSCIQAAVGRVKDNNDTLSRPTQRVSILITLLKDHGHESEFSKGIRSIVSRLLMEKENERGGSQVSSRWLVSEVCKSDKIQKTGTFRRAIGQYFEEKITPILAGTVALLDKNLNMDIIKETNGWKEKLWLDILNRNNLLDLKYSNFISRENSEVLNEFVVNNTGYGQRCFQSSFPFSWLYVDLIEKTLTSLEYKSEDEQGGDIVKHASDIINCDQELVSLLTNMNITDEIKKDMYISYIGDFIQMKYGNFNESLQKVIMELLITALNQCEYYAEKMDICEVLVAVHYVYLITKIRIQQLIEIAYIYPDVIGIIQQQLEKNGGHPLLDNRVMTIDVMALSILLESLEPEKKQLTSPEGRKEWFERACKYLTVTEKILDSSEEQNGLEYSPICKEFLLRIRCLWTRIMTIKLFIEHFSSESNKKTDQSIRWQMLWMQLTENADLHKIECLQKVEKFLKMINSSVLKKLLGDIGKCSKCGNPFESTPLQLPCQHKVCDSCYNDIRKDVYKVCPECQKVIPSEFDNQIQRSNDSDDQNEIKNFQRNCNSFLMALVSKLCFTSNQPPEPAVIEKLMEYIAINIRPTSTSSTHIQTKPMSVFTNVIDPTPVCRLFLLKLLAKKSFDVVESYLQKYFEYAQHVIEQEADVPKKQLFVEFCFLVCQCLEDMLYERSLDSVDQYKDEIQTATQYLDRAALYLLDNCEVIGKLNHISRCRFGLDITAKYLNMCCKTKRVPNADMKRLFKAAKDVLNIEPNWMWPKKYLIKQICRMYGTDIYTTLMDDDQFKWIGFENKEPLVQDRFIIYGENYLNIRKQLSLVDMGSNVKQLNELKGKADWEIMFVMALLNKVPTFQSQMFEKLKPFIEKNMKKEKDLKELALTILSSEQGSSPLFSVRCTSLVETKNIEYLLCHWLLALKSTPENTILQPLVNLVFNTTTMRDSFLPTMPEEDRENLNLLHSVLKQKESTAVVYRCPNGHPYVIGDCGRPYTKSKCNECAQDIGGQSHNALARNVLDSGTADSTKKGHILGYADQRSNISTPERSLSPVMCSIVRLLTHMSLYLSSKRNQREVKQLVEERYVSGNIEEFFLHHIQKDIGVLQHTLNKSSDDIFLLMNIVCKHLILHLPSDKIDRNKVILNTKDARGRWENRMNKALKPVVQDLDSQLRKGNEDIISNDSGADELLAIVYEKDIDEETDINNLQYNSIIWKYRERITIQHFLRNFQLQIIDKEKEGQSFKIIRLFKQELHHLQVQRFLPSIIKLLHVLMQKFCRKIDRGEASNISMEEVFKKEFTDNGEVLEYFDNFIQAWEILKEKLVSHVCRIDDNVLLSLPSEYHNAKLDLKSRLAAFLPSTKGPGVCSYILVDFLCRKHNEFLESICLLRKQKFEDIITVHSKDLTTYHLFSFHLVKDIEPLVLSNCHYSFYLHYKGSEITYDFDGFENQAVDRLFSRKSRILTNGPVIPIETMLFKADSSNALVFTAIRNLIPQIHLNSVVKRQITEELQKLTNICDSINNLDVATSFVKSLGGEPEMNIHIFMSDTLKMQSSLMSPTARSECKLQHIQSLWLILSFAKEKILTLRKKDSFVDFEEGLNVKVEDSDKTVIEEECKKLSIEKLEVILHFIYENILLKIAQPEVEYREMKLKELLCVELENCSNFAHRPPEYDKVNGDIFLTWPENVLGIHAIHVWKTILHVFTKKDEDYFG